MHAEHSTAVTAGPAAFRGFYREHYGFVWHVLGRFGVAPAEHGDALQDTFVTAYRKLPVMRNHAPRSWLYGIARRVASNYRRGAQRASRKQAAFAQAGGRAIAPATSEALAVLDQFLDGLDDGDRELFVLSELLGLSGPELVAATGVAQRIVYARLRLLRRRLVEAAPEELFAALSQLRADAPRASERTWSAIGAALSAELVVPASASFGLAKLGAIVGAIGAVGAAGILVTARPEPRMPMTPALSGIAASPPVQPRVRPEPSAVVLAVSPEPTPVVSSEAPPRATAKPMSASPTPPSTLARDNAMMREIVDAIGAGDAARALALTDAHARSFADSPQSDVRAALRIDALCRLGRGPQARGERNAFLARHASSPVAERVRAACPEP